MSPIPAQSPARPAPWAWRVAVLSAAFLGAAGWILSLLGALDARGYLVALALLAVAVAGLLPRPSRPVVRRRRWRRTLPRLFLLLAALSLAGGLLYEPNNIDALAYRTPRVLHWLAEGRWHWIDCPYNRLNTRATGFEWLTAPVLALLGTDRPLFLINLAAFLALPGLTFTTLRLGGIRSRIAWHWMWIFPGGYCFVLQAGSIANDLYGAATALAAFAFALRARHTGRLDDLLFSGLAMALATGAKLSNLPLLLPWAWTLLPVLPALARKPLPALAAGLLALLASIVPISVANQRHGGDWTGSRAEYAWTTPPDPVSALVHNAGLLISQNLLPPILPVAGAWNRAVEAALPERWKSRLDAFAENGRRAYAVRELPGEEHAGLGFGVSWLILSGFLARRGRTRRKPAATPSRAHRILQSLSWASLLPYLAKSGITTAGRILAPYYGWILPALLTRGHHSERIRSRLWRGFAAGSLALAALVLILLPSRPLWPALTLLERLGGSDGTGALGRATTVYRIYRERAHALAPIRDLIPPGITRIGFVTANDAETSLWKPYGTRRVRHLPPDATGPEIATQDIGWIVVSTEALAIAGETPEAWATARGLEIVARRPIRLLASGTPTEWLLVRRP